MKKLALLLLILLSLFGCSRNRVRRTMPVEKRMELANFYFEGGRYNRAAEHYTEVVFERSSIYTPLAQFRLGESYFKQSRYADAVFEYRELIRLFPEFSEINTAYFRIGESHFNQSLDPQYSQRETIQAIEAFEIFLDRFPFDVRRDEALQNIQQAQYKLIGKKYNNGYIYYRLYDYSAALMYFSEIIVLSNRDELDLKSRYYAARIYLEREDRENTEEMLESLRNFYPDSRERARIEKLYQRTF